MHKGKSPTLVILFCLLLATSAATQTSFTRKQYAEDFDYLWRAISDDYAYFDQKQTDWNKVREIYRPQISTVKTRSDFVAFLESVLEELYDFHTHLNTNTEASPHCAQYLEHFINFSFRILRNQLEFLCVLHPLCSSFLR